MSRFQKIVTRYSDGMPNAAPDVVSDIQFLLGAYNACCDALDDQRSEVRKLTVQRDALRADAAQQAADLAKLQAFVANDARMQDLWAAFDKITPEIREASAKKWEARSRVIREDTNLGRALREAREAWKDPGLYVRQLGPTDSEHWCVHVHSYDEDGRVAPAKMLKGHMKATELEALTAATAAAGRKRGE